MRHLILVLALAGCDGDEHRMFRSVEDKLNRLQEEPMTATQIQTECGSLSSVLEFDQKSRSRRLHDVVKKYRNECEYDGPSRFVLHFMQELKNGEPYYCGQAVRMFVDMSEGTRRREPGTIKFLAKYCCESTQPDPFLPSHQVDCSFLKRESEIIK